MSEYEVMNDQTPTRPHNKEDGDAGDASASERSPQNILHTDFDALLLTLFDGYIREITTIIDITFEVIKLCKKYYTLETDAVWSTCWYWEGSWHEDKVFFFSGDKDKEWHNFEIDLRISKDRMNDEFEGSINEFVKLRAKSLTLQVMKLEFEIMYGRSNVLALGIVPYDSEIVDPEEFGQKRHAFMIMSYARWGENIHYDKNSFQIEYGNAFEWNIGDMITFALDFNAEKMYVWSNKTLMYQIKFNAKISYRFVGALWDRYECYHEPQMKIC